MYTCMVGHYNITFYTYINGGTYSLKSTSNDRFFEKLFMAILFTLRVFARNQQSPRAEEILLYILFWCLAWGSNLGFTSNKPTHYLLGYGKVYVRATVKSSFKSGIPETNLQHVVGMCKSVDQFKNSAKVLSITANNIDLSNWQILFYVIAISTLFLRFKILGLKYIVSVILKLIK